MTLLCDASPYHLSAGMADFTHPASNSRVRRPDSGRVNAEALVLDKLGVKGWGRLEHFRLFYGGGWGKGPQKPLSPRSYDTLIRALTVIQPPPNARPSVFLTDGGCLELAWKDDQDRAFQIEFGPRESEIYDEARGIDQTLPNAELLNFLRRMFQ